jgi:hypothetical protein
MSELLGVYLVSVTLSLETNYVSRRFGIGRRFREAIERAALDL